MKVVIQKHQIRQCFRSIVAFSRQESPHSPDSRYFHHLFRQLLKKKKKKLIYVGLPQWPIGALEMECAFPPWRAFPLCYYYLRINFTTSGGFIKDTDKFFQF
jgi:hypothetical protein